MHMQSLWEFMALAYNGFFVEIIRTHTVDIVQTWQRDSYQDSSWATATRTGHWAGARIGVFLITIRDLRRISYPGSLNGR